jgi:hypothetical protein
MKGTLHLGSELVHYSEYGHCVLIGDDTAGLIVAIDYGPRVMSYFLEGGQNVLFNNRDPNNVKKGPAFDEVFYPGAYWNIYGGNRLWVSPHSFPHAFYPDNEPVDAELLPDGAVFRCRPQKVNEVCNEVEIRMDKGKGRVSLRFRVTNVGKSPKRMGAWSVTAVAPGGLEIIPQPTLPAGVLPNRRIALWDYTAMRDERIYWGNSYVAVKQDPNNEKPLKLGINNIDGWACYVNEGSCFLCRHPHVEGAEYPDFGVSYETYTHDRMLEMESLSPLALVAPGASVEHTEEWELFPAQAPLDWRNETEVAAFVAANIAAKDNV